jgi:hypothetical protein
MVSLGLCTVNCGVEPSPPIMDPDSQIKLNVAVLAANLRDSEDDRQATTC